jgi:hypothetical protein
MIRHPLDGAAIRRNYNHAEETEHHVHPAAASAAKPGQLIKPRNMSAKAQRRRAIKAHKSAKASPCASTAARGRLTHPRL